MRLTAGRCGETRTHNLPVKSRVLCAIKLRIEKLVGPEGIEPIVEAL